MLIKAIMIIWLGATNAQTFDTVPFPSMAECTSAREAMAQGIGDKWDTALRSYSKDFRNDSICVSLTGDQ